MTRAAARWDERIARARHLADRCPAAADMLTFYAKLADYQKAFAARWAAARAGPVAGLPHPPAPDPPISTQPNSGVKAEAVRLREPVLEAVADFLAWLADAAPPRLAGAVVEMRRLDRSVWRAVLDEYLERRGSGTTAAHAPHAFVVEALLQPLAEQLATEGLSSAGPPTSPPATATNCCPFCDQAPVVGVLREAGEGAKRSLVCGLCLTEWNYLRLVCPSCGEHRFDALPVFTSEQVPGARVEACDTCRRYVKTIDLTVDGNAVPYVDDFATVSLDLWAREQGYARLRSNLLMT